MSPTSRPGVEELYLDMGAGWKENTCMLHLSLYGIPEFTKRKFTAINLGQNTELRETYLLIIGLVPLRFRQLSVGGVKYTFEGWDEAILSNPSDRFFHEEKGKIRLYHRVVILKVPTDRWHVQEKHHVSLWLG
jgi:hypothetical protein